MTLQELYEKRGRIVAEARELLTKAEAEAGKDETRAKQFEDQHDALMKGLDELDAKIAREERTAQAEQAEEERRSRQRPNGSEGSASGSDEPGGNIETDAGQDQRQAEYRDAFYAAIRTGGDLSGLEPEQRALLRQGFVESRVQTAGVDAAGGYTVPTQLANRIVETMLDWGPMYDPGVTDEIVTSGGNQFDIPTNDDTGNSAAALAEGADLTDDGSGDLEFGEKTLGAYVYATPWLKISFELLQDSAFDIEAFVGKKIGQRAGRIANNRLTVGTGVGMPTGIVTASALGHTAASAVALVGDELIDMQHSVNSAYRRSPKCGWMFNDNTLSIVRKMKDGDGNYLWQMGDVRIGAPDLILGKGYHVNDDMADIAANARPIIFGDLSAYLVRKVGNPLIGTVRERFWPKVGMAGLIRFDGELTDTTAVKHLKMAAA